MLLNNKKSKSEKSSRRLMIHLIDRGCEILFVWFPCPYFVTFSDVWLDIHTHFLTPQTCPSFRLVLDLIYSITNRNILLFRREAIPLKITLSIRHSRRVRTSDIWSYRFLQHCTNVFTAPCPSSVSFASRPPPFPPSHSLHFYFVMKRGFKGLPRHGGR